MAAVRHRGRRPVNVAGLCAIAFVPENVDIDAHNTGCLVSVVGGVAVLAASFRRGKWADVAWLVWFAVVVALFAVFLNADAIPFSLWVPTTQKVLILSFAVWAGRLAWKEERRGRRPGFAFLGSGASSY